MKNKPIDDLIVIPINAKSQERVDEIVDIVKKLLGNFSEVDIESVYSGETAWIIDGG
jgi:hypothetical protein